MLLVDVSGSMRFGAIPGISERAKMVTAAQAAAIVGVTAMRNNDLLGLVTFRITASVTSNRARAAPHAGDPRMPGRRRWLP